MHADRRTKLHLRAQAIIFHALFAALVVGLAWLSVRYAVELDWTAARRNSISEQSLALLDRIEGPVVVTAYATAAQPARRALIAKVIGRYQARKPDLTLAFVDPNTVPDKVRALGLTADGTLVIEHAGRSEKVPPDFRGSYPESELTNALQRLMRGGERFVAFLEGHGERRFDGQQPHDLGAFGRMLAARGIKLTHLNLATVERVPDNVAVLVVSAPQSALLPREVDRLLRFVAEGGNLLWLADPMEDRRQVDGGLAPLARALGVQVLPGVIVDPGAGAFGVSDPRGIVVSGYEPAPFTRDFALNTLFPFATAIGIGEGAAFTARPFALAGDAAWLETDLATATPRFDPKADRGAPLALGVYLGRPRLDPASGAERGDQRVVVTGDGDFLSNQFVGEGGNLELGLNLLSWLAQDDDFIDINVRATPDASLALDDGQLLALAAAFLLLLPLGLIAIGVWIWWRRRRG